MPRAGTDARRDDQRGFGLELPEEPLPELLEPLPGFVFGEPLAPLEPLLEDPLEPLLDGALALPVIPPGSEAVDPVPFVMFVPASMPVARG